jgi:hypothetical protein
MNCKRYLILTVLGECCDEWRKFADEALNKSRYKAQSDVKQNCLLQRASNPG